MMNSKDNSNSRVQKNLHNFLRMAGRNEDKLQPGIRVSDILFENSFELFRVTSSFWPSSSFFSSARQKVPVDSFVKPLHEMCSIFGLELRMSPID